MKHKLGKCRRTVHQAPQVFRSDPAGRLGDAAVGPSFALLTLETVVFAQPNGCAAQVVRSSQAVTATNSANATRWLRPNSAIKATDLPLVVEASD